MSWDDDEGHIDDSLDGDDMAAAWLSEMGEGTIEEEVISPDQTIYGTVNSLVEGKFAHEEQRILAGIVHVAGHGTFPGVDPLKTQAAYENFAKSIDGSVSDFVGRMKVDPEQGLPRASSDINRVLSLMGGIEGYQSRGPGQQLPGNVVTAEGASDRAKAQSAKKQAKLDDDMRKALGYANELADMYIHPSTPRDGDVYARKHAGLVNSLINRSLESVQYSGAQGILPMPNETGVHGIRKTMGTGGAGLSQGTAFDRVGFAVQAEKSGWSPENSETKNEYFQHLPSLKNSLFPWARGAGKTEEGREKAKRDQDYLMGQALEKATIMRRILREQMPTNRDESAGQIRHSGFDRVYADQEERQAALDLAFSYDISGSAEPTSDEDKAVTDLSLVLDASTQMGSNLQYVGARAAVEAHLDEEVAVNPGDELRGLYEKNRFGIEQRTDEWYQARKGLVTASKLLDFGSGKQRSAEEMAALLARERLGAVKDEFYGNAYTREGVEGEAIALRAFLNDQKGKGDPMEHTEVGLLQNPDFPGLGASPDGRLTRKKDGSDAGLLELKYLTPSAMKTALKKYTPQMQLQMAVTGAKTTQFFALNQYTNESINHTVHADPVMQREIIERGSKAVALAASLDAEGVTALEEEIKTAKQRSSGTTAAVEGAGDSVFVAPSEVPEEPMPSYGGVEAEGVSARVFRARQAGRHNSMDDLGSNNTVSDAEAEALRESAKKTAKAIEGLGNSAGKAVKTISGVAAELANVVLSGTESGMSTVRFAAEAGMDENKTRGLEYELTTGKGGMDLSLARSNMRRAGELVSTFNNKTLQAGAITQLSKDWAASEVLKGPMPTLDDVKGMDQSQILGYVADLGAGKSEEYKRELDRVFGTQMAVSNLSGDTIRNASIDLGGEELRDSFQGKRTIEKIDQDFREGSAKTAGETGTMAAAGAKVADSIVNSKTAAAVGGGLTAGASMLAGKAALTGALPAAATVKGAVAAAATSTAAASGAALLAAGAAGYGVGTLINDNFISGTSFGDMIGSGVAHMISPFSEEARNAIEAQDRFDVNQLKSSSYAVPDKSLASHGAVAPVAKTEVNNSIEVNVAIDPKLAKIDVEVDGEELQSTEQTFTT